MLCDIFMNMYSNSFDSIVSFHGENEWIKYVSSKEQPRKSKHNLVCFYSLFYMNKIIWILIKKS